MRAVALAVVAALFCVTSTGCATLMTGAGPNQTVKIASNPRGARVFVDGDYKGLTPIGVPMTRADDHVVTLEMDGYQSMTRDVKAGYNPWHLGNILFGGVVGITIDLLDGSFLWLGGGVNQRLARLPSPDGAAESTAVASSQMGSPRNSARYKAPGSGAGQTSAVTTVPRTAPVVADAASAPRPTARPAQTATYRMPGAGSGEPSRLPPRRQPAPAAQ
jgi:hypothetical protein